MKKIILSAVILMPATYSAQGQDMRGLNILMIDNDSRSVHLTAVTMQSIHTWFDETGRTDIHFSYQVDVLKKEPPREPLTINNDSYFKLTTSVRFIPTDSVGKYKIEEMTTSDSSRKHFGHPAPPQWRFAGYSNDTTLLAVKAYNYYKSHAPQYLIYEPKQLDEQPYFTFDGAKSGIDKYVTEKLRIGYEEIAKNMSGSVEFSYVIHPYGWAIDFNVAKIKLKPKNNLISINGVDTDFGSQIDILFRRINYLVVEYGYYTRYDRRFWTPGKLNGEPVASRQYFTLKFK